MKSKNEKPKENSDLKTGKKNGGARPGAGRKKGGKNPATLEKERTLREIKQRISRSADKLLNAQLSVALGNNFLFKVITIKETGLKLSEMVEDPDEILAYFNGDFDEGGAQHSEDTYYLITTSKPNIKAIDSLLDRGFGKAKESIEVDDKRARKKITIEIIDARRELGEKNKSDESVSGELGGIT